MLWPARALACRPPVRFLKKLSSTVDSHSQLGCSSPHWQFARPTRPTLGCRILRPPPMQVTNLEFRGSGSDYLWIHFGFIYF